MEKAIEILIFWIAFKILDAYWFPVVTWIKEASLNFIKKIDFDFLKVSFLFGLIFGIIPPLCILPLLMTLGFCVLLECFGLILQHFLPYPFMCLAIGIAYAWNMSKKDLKYFGIFWQ